MFKKLMKHLTNNPGLKILSIMIAVILWLIVVNYDNPETSRVFTIPVTVTNEEILEDMGKVYEVVGQSNLAVIYVKGKRSYLDSLSSIDFFATADLSQIDFQGEGNEKLVPINVTARRYEKNLNITAKTINMQIRLEDLSEVQSYISCDTQGNPADGYAIGEVTISPNLIKISGPQSIVSRISRVVANVNVEGMTEDISDSVVPVLYNENGGVIESSQLRLSQERVNVSIQILGTKTVPIRCEVSGTPADGYQFINLEYAPETISIKGETSVLNAIQEIVIPGDAINLDGVREDMESSIDLTPYLEAANVSLVNQEEGKVAIKAVVEQLDTKNITLPVESLKILNLPENYRVIFDETEIKIPIRGRSEDLQQLSASQVQAEIDLENHPPGVYTVEVSIKVDEKFQVVGTITMGITVTNLEEASEEEREDIERPEMEPEDTERNNRPAEDGNSNDSE